MPLIWYRIGDEGRSIPGDCPCGTLPKTLERVRKQIGGIEIGADGYTALALRRQLDAVPSIQSAQEAGRLDVCVDLQITDWRSTPEYRSSKRSILDRTSS